MRVSRGTVKRIVKSKALTAAPLRVLTLVVPMPENLANTSQRGWRGLHARKLKYFAMLDSLQLQGVLPPPPRRPFERAAISAVMHLGTAMDDGNAMHRCEKWPCDWLKTRGYIVDDRKKNLTWDGLPSQVIKRDGNYRIALTLTEQQP